MNIVSSKAKRIGEWFESFAHVAAVVGLLIACLTFYNQYMMPRVDVKYAIIPRHYHYDTLDGGLYNWTSDLVVSNEGAGPLIVTFVGHSLAFTLDVFDSGVGMMEAARFIDEGEAMTKPVLPYIVRAGQVAVIRVNEEVLSGFVDHAMLDPEDSLERRLYLQFEAVDANGQIVSMAGAIARFHTRAVEPDFEYLETEWVPLGRLLTLTSPPPSTMEHRHTPETW